MSHHIVFEDGKYRCLQCRAVSLKRSIIDEIPCTKETETFTKVPKRDEGDTYTFTFVEPYFPKVGDTWLTRNGLYVYVTTRDDVGWMDVDTGRMREGQGHLPGEGFNPAVKKLQRSQSYSNDLLKSKALGVNTRNEAREQVSAALVGECFKRNQIQVTPIEVDETPASTIAAMVFTATCMVIDRPPAYHIGVSSGAGGTDGPWLHWEERKGWVSSVPASAGTHTSGWIVGTHRGKDA